MGFHRSSARGRTVDPRQHAQRDVFPSQQYYGNPRNAFWRITGELFGFAADDPYDDRTAALVANGVAVWDVLKSCRRAGSLDSAVEPDSMVANDFGELFSNNQASHGSFSTVQQRRRTSTASSASLRMCSTGDTFDESGPDNALRGQADHLARSDNRTSITVPPATTGPILRSAAMQAGGVG